MLRRIICSVFIFSAIICNSQVISLPTDFDGHVTYDDVVEIEGISIDSLKKVAMLFLKGNENISELKEVDGKITAKGYEDFIGGAKKVKMKMSYDITIEFKDGKYKYTITNFEYRAYPDEMNPQPMPMDVDELYEEYKQLLAQGKESNKKVKNTRPMFAITDREIKEFIAEMEKFMKNPVIDEDDW